MRQIPGQEGVKKGAARHDEAAEEGGLADAGWNCSCARQRTAAGDGCRGSVRHSSVQKTGGGRWQVRLVMEFDGSSMSMRIMVKRSRGQRQEREVKSRLGQSLTKRVG